MSSTTSNASNGPPPGRFLNRRLRRASFISPSTGERSKRVFTLREASHRLNGDIDGTAGERTPLLAGHGDEGEAAVSSTHRSRWDAFKGICHQQVLKSWGFATSKTGLGILKCSLAYLLGSSATLVPAVSGLIGNKQDSKHMVATVTVWFHPARSIGSMHEVSSTFIICLSRTITSWEFEGHLAFMHYMYASRCTFASHHSMSP